MSLIFESVTRRYGDVVALNRVSLELEGGITALVGPNGSGKSTFMKLATGHVKPTAGKITAFGQTVWDNPDVMRRVGFVPEQDAFWENMSGHEFVGMLAEMSGVPHAHDAAGEELRALGLSQGMDAPIRTYSKGMRQRVKLAQALLHRPDMLFLDEPLLGCDPVARRRIQDRVRSLRNEGATIIVSSHILPEVERLTRDVAVINGGRLVAQGDMGSIRAAMGQVPSRIRVHAEQARAVAKEMAGWDMVSSVSVRDGAVDVETDRMRDVLEKIQYNGMKVEGVEALDADLDSLFTYLGGDQ